MRSRDGWRVLFEQHPTEWDWFLAGLLVGGGIVVAGLALAMVVTA